MLRASKTYKGWSPQGSWPSPLEGVARGAERCSSVERVAAPSLFPHRTSVVRVYVYWNAETSTADLMGRDLRQLAPEQGPRTSVVRVYVYWNTETSTADLAGRDLCQTCPFEWYFLDSFLYTASSLLYLTAFLGFEFTCCLAL